MKKISLGNRKCEIATLNGNTPVQRALPTPRRIGYEFFCAAKTDVRPMSHNTFGHLFRVTTWGKQAEVCNQYVKKGMKVLVEGRLTPDKATGGPRIWTKQDGSAGSSFEVTAGTVRFLSSRGDGSEGPMMGGMESAELPAEDDIPF